MEENPPNDQVEETEETEQPEEDMNVSFDEESGTALMRAKMRVAAVHSDADSESMQVTMTAVGKVDGYPEDGSDEDNTFARFTPSAELVMVINNPNLFGRIEEGQKFYLDFVPAE